MTLNPVRTIRGIRSHVGNLERGAALVEAAIAIPILLLVIMGSVEFGFGWEAKSSSTSAVRSATLRAATLGDEPSTDMAILQSVVSEVGRDNVDRIGWVMVFDAQDADKEAAISSCEAGTNTNGCVVYDAAFVQAVASTNNAGALIDEHFDSGGHEGPTGYVCDTKAATGREIKDASYCAGLRTENGIDSQVGIAVQYNHEWFTGIFPFDPPTFQDHTVTSTFQNSGAAISPTTVNIPSGIGQVFKADFDTGTIPGGVSTTKLGSLPIEGEASKGVLGQFGSDTVSFTAPIEQTHTEVCVSATLWIIGSWDQDSGKHGPDTFDVNIDGQDTKIDDQVYSQDDKDTTLDKDAHAGNFDYAQKVQIYECVPHTGDSVTVDFSAILTQNNAVRTVLKDESWALGDVTISVEN